jgi:hypothetical protein
VRGLGIIGNQAIDPLSGSVPHWAVFTLQSICWHDICNVVTRGEQMSYKGMIRANRQQIERQQEKLRLAREALARVEAKYARKRHVKQSMEPTAKMGVQRPHRER